MTGIAPHIRVKHLAARTGLTQQFIRDEIRAGRLPHKRFRGLVLIPEAAAIEWFERYVEDCPVETPRRRLGSLK